MIGKTISHYKILEKLGEGGMGVVYKAFDTALNRNVALKFLPSHLTKDEPTRKRFIVEAQAASSLDHPNICNIHEINKTPDEQLYICMGYYKGESLRQKIKKGPIPLNEAVNIIFQIAQGLKRAHEEKIIHRDIKPGNILITEKGEVKIVDFGLAKLAGVHLTQSTSSKGTVAYMCPEQIRGEKVDHRCDIWALGVVFYEMLTGHLPFRGEYPEPMMFSIVNEEPPPLSQYLTDFPESLQLIIDKLLKKDPNERYLNISDMLVDLESLLKESGLVVIKMRSSITRLLFRKKSYLYGIAAIFIMILLLILAKPYLFPKRSVGNSIAVLPLESITQDAEQEWFTDSMTDALITDLAKVSGLRVISRSSAMKYKGTNKTPPEIAAELGVQYVIEGSIVKMGDQVKISARLINAPNDEYLWAEEYERGFSNILGLQGEIAQAIASKIQVKLTPQEETLLAVSRSVNPEVHELYLKGMYHLRKYTPDGFANGLRYLHQAVEKDPEEPLAHAGLAIGYSIIAHTPSPPPGAMLKSKEEGHKALELDESLGETHLAVAMAQIYGDWDKEGAEKSYKRALELNPSLAEAYNQYAWYLLLIGKEDEAIKSLKQAQEVDPLTSAYPAWLGMLYFWLERNDEAIEEALKSLELVPDFPIALMALGSVYAVKGMFEEAIEAHQKVGAISLDWKWCLGQTYALAGRRDDALAVVTELESQPKVWYTWGLAEVYTALGDKDEAFYWLNEAYKQRHPYIQWIWRNPSLKPLRNDPRFADLAQRLNVKI